MLRLRHCLLVSPFREVILSSSWRDFSNVPLCTWHVRSVSLIVHTSETKSGQTFHPIHFTYKCRLLSYCPCRAPFPAIHRMVSVTDLLSDNLNRRTPCNPTLYVKTVFCQTVTDSLLTLWFLTLWFLIFLVSVRKSLQDETIHYRIPQTPPSMILHTDTVLTNSFLSL